LNNYFALEINTQEDTIKLSATFYNRLSYKGDLKTWTEAILMEASLACPKISFLFIQVSKKLSILPSTK
jgi:hypothetical protein